MNAAVDGVATPAERRELEGIAEVDPAVREEFEQAVAVAALLAAMPQIEPPGDLASRIVAKVTLSSHNAPRADQLMGRRRVSGLHAGPNAGFANFARTIRFQKEHFMSEVKRGFLGTTKSRVFAGGALAVVALAVVSLQINFPSSGADTAGTIAPAERYRSGQPTDANVQSSGSTGTTSTTPVTAAQEGAAANAANAAAANSANAAAANAANAAAANSANAAAANSANAAAANSANAAAANSANAAAANAANAAANRSAANAANAAAANSANAAAANAANAAANRSAANAANNAAANAANAAAANSANAAAANAANAAANKAANKAANATQN